MAYKKTTKESPQKRYEVLFKIKVLASNPTEAIEKVDVLLSNGSGYYKGKYLKYSPNRDENQPEVIELPN